MVICYGSLRKLKHKRIPNNSCSYSTLKVGEHTSPLIRPRLCTGTSFQNAQYGERKQSIIWWWRNLKDTTSARWSRPTSTVITHVDSLCAWYDVMENGEFWGFSPHLPPKPSPITWFHEKNTGQIQYPFWSRLQNTWPVLLKTAKVGASLMVQWLRLCTFNAGYTVLIPGQGTCCVASPKSFKKSA